MKEFKDIHEADEQVEHPIEQQEKKPDPLKGNPYSEGKGEHFETAYTLKPNQTYEANKTTYHTDEHGHIDQFSGDLSLEAGKRHQADQQHLQGKTETDHAGHLISRETGGSGYVDNLVPMDGKVNTRDYRAFERENRAILENDYDVHLDGDVYYSSEDGRPDAFMVTREIKDKDGNVVDREHLSWTNIDMAQFEDMEEDWYDEDIPNPMHDPDYPQLTQEEYDEIDNVDLKNPFAQKHKPDSNAINKEDGL